MSPSFTLLTKFKNLFLHYPPRAQLALAALFWLLGATLLLYRGLLYFYGLHGFGVLLALIISLLLGEFKAQKILIPSSLKSIQRIQVRGPSCFFSFFSWKNWLLIAIMMGSGIALRHWWTPHTQWSREILGMLYLSVGSALLFADLSFWKAFWKN